MNFKKEIKALIAIFLSLCIVFTGITFVDFTQQNGHIVEFGQEVKAATLYYYDKYTVGNGSPVRIKQLSVHCIADSFNYGYEVQGNILITYYNWPNIDSKMDLSTKYPGYASYYVNSERRYQSPTDTYEYEYWYLCGYTYGKGTISQSNLVAPDGTYPDNGKHTDGYWYVKKGMANQNPTVTITSPQENEISSLTIPLKGTVNDTDTGDILAIKYKIDSTSEQSISGTVTSNGIDQPFTDTTIDISNLAEGDHTLNIWGVDDKGGTSPVKVIKFSKQSIYLSVLSDNSSTNKAELKINDFSKNVSQYQISCNNLYVTEEGKLTKTPVWIRRLNNSITSSAVIVTGLEPDTKYTFTLKGRTLEGEPPVTYNTVTYYTQLPKVEGINIKSESSQLIISWKSVYGASYYSVEADGNVTTTSALSFDHTGLAPNTSHSYRVKAESSNSSSVWSEVFKARTSREAPITPTNMKVNPLGTELNFTWQPVSGAMGYELELDGNMVKTGVKTSYTYTGLKPLTQHTYRIRSNGINSESPWSPLETIYTTDGLITAFPQNVTAKATNNSVTLNWESVDDAEGYDIMPVLGDGTTGAAIDNGSLTTCDFRGLLPNTTYRYMVRAKNSAGEGPWSNEIQITTFLLDTPQNVVTEKNDISIKFSWDVVEDADSYEFKYLPLIQTVDASGTAINVSAGNEVTVDVPTGSSITIDGLTPNTGYIYTLRAKNVSGFSGWRDEKSTFTLPQKPGIPENVNASVSDTKIIINWTGLFDPLVVGYDVELDGVILENDTEITYIHEGLEPYSLHTYRVRARNELVEGDWSTISSIRTLPAKPVAPKEVTVKSTQTGATLSWESELGASGYDLYVFKLDDNDQEVFVEEIDNIEDCTYTHRKQVKGEEYRYRIRTRNIQGISEWGGDIINNAIKAECKKKETIDLGLTATDVVDFSSYEMVVTYNPGVVDVVDLSTITGKPELSIGKIEGTGITIKEFSDGRIVFVVDKAITPGEAWTGVINGIKFKAKETGGTTITYTVYTKQEE